MPNDSLIELNLILTEIVIKEPPLIREILHQNLKFALTFSIFTSINRVIYIETTL